MIALPFSLTISTLREGHLAALCAGVAASLSFPQPLWGLLGFLLVPLAIHHQRWVLVAFLAGLAGAAFNGEMWLSHQLPGECLGREVSLAGRIVTLPREQRLVTGQRRVTAEMDVIRVDDPSCAGPKRVRVIQYLEGTEVEPSLRYHTHVSGRWRFKPLASQMNPGSHPDQARWASRGIDAAATPVGQLTLTPTHHPIARFRSLVLDAWADRKGEGWAAMRALLLGDTRSMSQTVWRDLRHLGVIHVLVISGLHIGLLASLCFIMFQLPRRLVRIPGDSGSMLFTAVSALMVTGCYAVLVGASLPVMRAYLMLVAGQLPQLLGWNTSGRHGLLLAISAMLLWDPRILLGGSFWLSAGATWLLVCSPWQSLGIRSLIAIQIKMIVLMSPMTLFWFGETSLLGLVTNLVLVPVVTLTMVPLGLIGLLLFEVAPTFAEQLWWCGAQIWLLLRMGFDWILGCCRGWAVMTANSGALQFGLGLFALLLWGESRRYASIAFLVAALFPWPERQTSTENSMTLLDVGQGLSAVIQVGERTLIYDTGYGEPGGFTQAEKVLLPYLTDRDIKQVDMLLISHADLDHSGGAPVLREHLPIGRSLGFGGEPCRNGERWIWHSVEFLIINGPGQGEMDRNDGSCGLLIQAPDWSVLSPGDVSAARERQWVRYWRDELEASILVLAHHGSRTSSSYALLKWISPDWALVSAGRGNAFGHPHDEVVERVKHSGQTALLSTAISGAIHISLAKGDIPELIPSRGPWAPYWLKMP
jgi:competence protein ComEC